MDGFVEDSTKVVDYGVRDVSYPMEGTFIVFYKWIPSWLILIDERIKYRRDMWEYVEYEAPWVRRWLCLSYKRTITPCW